MYHLCKVKLMRCRFGQPPATKQYNVYKNILQNKIILFLIGFVIRLIRTHVINLFSTILVCLKQTSPNRTLFALCTHAHIRECHICLTCTVEKNQIQTQYWMFVRKLTIVMKEHNGLHLNDA